MLSWQHWVQYMFFLLGLPKVASSLPIFWGARGEWWCPTIFIEEIVNIFLQFIVPKKISRRAKDSLFANSVSRLDYVFSNAIMVLKIGNCNCILGEEVEQFFPALKSWKKFTELLPFSKAIWHQKFSKLKNTKPCHGCL